MVFMLALVLLASGSASARCASQSKEALFLSTPYFVKGIVKNYKAPKKSSEGEISFRIEVLAALKGEVTQPSLTVRYMWVDQKEPLRTFKDGELYVFGITSIHGAEAKIEPSSCTPLLSENDVGTFNGTLNNYRGFDRAEMRKLYTQYSHHKSSDQSDLLSMRIGEMLRHLTKSCSGSDIEEQIKFIFDTRGSAEEQLSFNLVQLLQNCERELAQQLRSNDRKIVQTFVSRLHWGVQNKIYHCVSKECSGLVKKEQTLFDKLKIRTADLKAVPEN